MTTQTLEGLIIPQQAVTAAVELYTGQDFEQFRRGVQSTMRDQDSALMTLDYGLYAHVAAARSPVEADKVRAGFLLGYQMLKSQRPGGTLSVGVEAYIAQRAGSFNLSAMQSEPFQRQLIDRVREDFVASPAVDEMHLTTLGGPSFGPVRYGSRLVLTIYGKLANPQRPPFELPTVAPRPQVQRQQQMRASARNRRAA